ncbi:MAG: cation:proton antiporter [Candidatus Zixiibacteriota bacterium]
MIIIYLAAFYLITNLAGILIEKIRIPRIYAALFLGVLLSSTTWVLNIVSLDAFKLLSQVGMFSLLFLLGSGLDVKKLRQQSRLIVRTTTYVILSEFSVGILILHFIFGVSWVLAGIIAISFATVGEIALLPLLKEFKIINTDLGQTILGVAILDDITEILAFILMLAFVSGLHYTELFNEALPLTAIALGVVFKNLSRASQKFDKSVDFLALYVFGPIFFFTAGTEADLKILLDNFLLILIFTLIIKATKILSSYAASHKQLGTKKSIVLGVSLGIKFSTSIVLLIILLQKNLITQELFSILIGIKVVFKFILPIILSFLLNRWSLELVRTDKQK